ncbi:MAG: variant-type mycofactocin precursor [Desulfobacteraceae bacterium]|jgi:mycofactocin precursor
MEKKAVEENRKELAEETDKEMEHPMIVEEFEIEELSVDGICGVY